MRQILLTVFVTVFTVGCDDGSFHSIDQDQPASSQPSVTETSDTQANNSTQSSKQPKIDRSQVFNNSSKLSKEIFLSLEQCDTRSLAIRLKHVPQSGLVDKSSYSPLIRSVLYGCLEGMRLLLDHGVDINEQDGHGNTALHWASIKNNSSATRELLNNSYVDANIQDLNGRAAIHLAIYSQVKHHTHLDLDTIELLASSPKVDLNIKDNQETTPLIYATKLSDEEVMTLNRTELTNILLKAGVDIYHKDSYGMTAMDWALERKNKRVFDLIEDRHFEFFKN